MQTATAHMQAGLTVLHELSEGDIDWLLAEGREEAVRRDTALVKAGARIHTVYLVLDGLLRVFINAPGDRELATLGPGEIVGEMSFLEDRPASATVVAAEPSRLLVLERQRLEEKLREDPSFSARFYKALAMVTSRRLRDALGALGRWVESEPIGAPEELARWSEIARITQEFKVLLVKTDKLVGESPETNAGAVLGPAFSAFCSAINVAIGDNSAEAIDAREELGARVQREILPYLMRARTPHRLYAKPRGYACDFGTVELIEQNQPHGTGRLGLLLDRSFLALPAVAALRHRRQHLARIISQMAATRADPLRVTGIGVGPAGELFDAFAKLDSAAQLLGTIVEFDGQALAHLAARRKGLPFASQLELHSENLVRLAVGRSEVSVNDQDLVYCIGLPDHFSDRFMVSLLDYIHGLLRPGGRVVVGSFHPRNPAKAFLDHVLAWRAVHRSEPEVDAMLARSRFAKPCERFQIIEPDVYFLAEAVKGTGS